MPKKSSPLADVRPLFAVVLVTALSFTACGSSSPSSLDIYIINAPSILTVNQSVSLTAGVRGDSVSTIDWTCSATGEGGGTFGPAQTASGGPTVFTAAGTTGTVTITATATADSSVKAVATIVVVPAGSNDLFNGRYVFLVQGVDSDGRFCIGGTLIADGNGNITGGEQDYSGASLLSGPDPVTGSYSIGPDGRGSVTLLVAGTGVPNFGVETFSMAVTSASHALITQFDGTATSDGSFDLQSASAIDPAAIGGAYAFIAQGHEYANGFPISYGGVLKMSALSGTVDGGTYFSNGGGISWSGEITGSVTAPDTFGRGTIAFDWGLGFAYYAVQGQVLRLVGQNSPKWTTGGSMFGQGEAGEDATFSNASLTGDYVFFEAGDTIAGTMGLAGQFSADGAGRVVSGVVDVNDAGTLTFSSIADLATYAIDGTGAGSLILPATVDTAGNISHLVVFAVDPSINVLDPNSPNLGGAALVMEFEAHACATGYIVPRSSGAFGGSFALGLRLFNSAGNINWLGQTVAAGGGLTGTGDINDKGAASPGVTLSGTYSADAANEGRWTGALTVGSSSHAIRYYQVSPTYCIILDVDSTHAGIGIMETDEVSP
jgi:hypothetical protein